MIHEIMHCNLHSTDYTSLTVVPGLLPALEIIAGATEVCKCLTGEGKQDLHVLDMMAASLVTPLCRSVLLPLHIPTCLCLSVSLPVSLLYLSLSLSLSRPLCFSLT